MCKDNVKNTFMFSLALNTNICFVYRGDKWAGLSAVTNFFSV